MERAGLFGVWGVGWGDEVGGRMLADRVSEMWDRILCVCVCGGGAGGGGRTRVLADRVEAGPAVDGPDLELQHDACARPQSGVPHGAPHKDSCLLQAPPIDSRPPPRDACAPS